MAAVVSSGGRSTLNPDAPLFIPAAYRQVEDFSPEWWQLVNTTTWYKDYWLTQHQEEEGYYNNVAEEEYSNNDDVAGLLPDTFDLDVVGDDFASFEAQFDEFVESYEAEKRLPSYGNGYGIGGGGAGGIDLGFRAGITAAVGSPKFGY